MFPLQTKLAKESSEKKKIREFKKRSSPVEILQNKKNIFLFFHGPFFHQKKKKNKEKENKKVFQTSDRLHSDKNTCRNIKKSLEKADNAMRLQLEIERKRNNKLSQKTIQVPKKQT